MIREGFIIILIALSLTLGLAGLSECRWGAGAANAEPAPTWTLYQVSDLTLIIGSKSQNMKLFEELGNSTIYGLHPRGTRIYVSTPNPGVILHEFAHTFERKWAGHNHVPYRVREVREREVREIIGLSQMKLEPGQR